MVRLGKNVRTNRPPSKILQTKSPPSRNLEKKVLESVFRLRAAARVKKSLPMCSAGVYISFLVVALVRRMLLPI